MFRQLILFIGIGFNSHLYAQDVTTIYEQGKKCLAANDSKGYYQYMAKAFELYPQHFAIAYHFGAASVLNDKPQQALDLLAKAIWMNAELDLTGNNALGRLKSTPGWSDLLSLQQKLQVVVISSDTALVLSDRTLHLESVAVHKNTFYGASIRHRALVEIKKGIPVKMISRQNAPAFFGIAIDRQRDMLWASASPIEQMANFDSTLQSNVHGYSLSTKELKKTYTISKPSLLGDVVVSTNGEVFVSDSKNNAILTLSTGDTLQTFYSSQEFQNLQGIALSENNRFLFIADYVKGIYRLDLKSLNLKLIANSTEASLVGIDGLEYYNGSLIAIQNGVIPFRVMRYFLNETMDTITSYEVIDWNHPAHHEPTNGMIDGDTLYYVANSQWSGYDEAFAQLPSEKLQDIVVLKYKLKSTQ
jgi:hypothetical protein